MCNRTCFKSPWRSSSLSWDREPECLFSLALQTLSTRSLAFGQSHHHFPTATSEKLNSSNPCALTFLHWWAFFGECISYHCKALLNFSTFWIDSVMWELQLASLHILCSTWRKGEIQTSYLCLLLPPLLISVPSCSLFLITIRPTYFFPQCLPFGTA